jgi:hypothetical protein
MLDLLNLWKIWLDGKKLDDYLLWGHSILFWGRIGKLIGLLSATLIIVDIIGVDRLRTFGKSLHPVITREQTKQRFTSGIRWVKAILYYLYARQVLSAVIRKKWHRPDVIKDWRRRVEDAKGRLHAYSEYRWYYPLVIALTALIAFWLRHYFSSWELLWIAGLVWLLNHIFLVPIILGVVPLLLQVVALIIDALIIEPIAFVLEQKSLGTVVKIISLILLLIGFHFDFLAS